jgi:hypothetical protein
VLETLLDRTLRAWEAEAKVLGAAGELSAFRKRSALAIVEGRAATAERASPAAPLAVSGRLAKLDANLEGRLDFPEVRALLRARRARAARSGLDEADREREALVAKKQFADIEALRERTAAAWKGEVKALALEGELASFQTRCALAVARPQVAEAERLMAGNPLEASQRLRAIEAKLPEQPAFDAVRALLRDNRQKALRTALALARKDFADLQAKDDYVGMGELARGLQKNWTAEAKAVALEPELRRFCQTLLFLSELAAPLRKGKDKTP